MAGIPMAINNGAATSENYSYTHGKYSYGYYDETDFSQMPEGLLWIPSYDYNNFHSPGGGYFIISTTGNELVPIIGNDTPTFHVTGNTSQEILHVINQLHSIRTTIPFVYTNRDVAIRDVLLQHKYNQFDADLSNYKYTMFASLKLNFDFGNLNCDIRETNLSSAYSLIVDADGTNRYDLTTVGGSSIAYDKALSGLQSVYRIFNQNEFMDLETNGPALSDLNSISGDSFMFAMRLRMDTPSTSFDIINANINGLQLEADANVVRFTLGADQVTITGRFNDFITLIFGRNHSNEIFIRDGFNTASTSTNGTANAVFSNTFRLGNIGTNTGGLIISSLQYWKGGNYNSNKFHDVKNFQLHNERWPAAVNP
jgi:hypothetical protein